MHWPPIGGNSYLSNHIYLYERFNIHRGCNCIVQYNYFTCRIEQPHMALSSMLHYKLSRIKTNFSNLHVFFLLFFPLIKIYIAMINFVNIIFHCQHIKIDS